MAVIYYFDEVLLDPGIFVSEAGGAAPVVGSPEFGNSKIGNAQTAVFKVNVGRYDPTENLVVDLRLLSPTQRAYFINFWRGGYGSGVGFRVRVPYDFYVIDEVFGVGDGATTVFNLYATYTRPGVTARQDVRRILKPVTNTNVSGGVSLKEPNGSDARVIPSAYAASLGVPAFTIKKNNVATTAYTINNTTGVITFTTAPANGVVLTWSGEFDAPMTFADNSFQLRPDVASEVNGIRLRELLKAELGIT